MRQQQDLTLIVWLLLLWDLCDRIYIDALLCGYGEAETVAALDDIEHELEQLGVPDARAAADALRAMM